MTRDCLRAALVLALGATIGQAWSVPLISIEGTATGIFSNPQGPAALITTGVGTNTFSWGAPLDAFSTSSSLQFTGKAFDLQGVQAGYVYGATNQANRPTFSLGTLDYVNGTTVLGTEATGVRLDATVNVTVPFQGAPGTFGAAFGITTTPNTNDPTASADQVTLQRTFAQVPIQTPDGVTTSIEPVGFGNVTAGGFVGPLNQFNVLEGATASADLMARVASPCEPIVSGAVTVDTPQTWTFGTKSYALNGAGMVATFTPANSLTLAAAATNCGYDHFDWYQQVYHDPIPPKDVTGATQVAPYVDPPKGGYAGKWADNLPYYWNENLTGCPTATFACDSYALSTYLTGNTLTFVDVPYQGGLAAGEYLGFQTALVGIRANGKSDVLYTWNWKTDYNGGVLDLSGARQAVPEDVDLGGAGNVFDINLDMNPWQVDPFVRANWEQAGVQNADVVIPEPGSIMLLLLGLLALAGHRARAPQPHAIRIA